MLDDRLIKPKARRQECPPNHKRERERNRVTLDDLCGQLDGVRRAGDGYSAKCPAHEDRNASLSIGTGADGRILLKCHAGCETDAICAALGITVADLFADSRDGHSHGKPEIVATYDYTDESGKLLYQVCRMAPKDFRQRRPDPTAFDGWTWSTKGVRKVLYRLPKIVDAVKRGLPILIVEGEKDVHACEARGFTATCNPGGAGKWLNEYSETLRGADVVILPDNDEAGRNHADLVASKLQGTAKKVKIVALPRGKDSHDFFAAAGTAEELIGLIDAAPKVGVIEARPLFDLQVRRESDPDELLRDRYLCRGGGLLMVGPTGVGKSVLLMQMLVSWALGRGCFGIEPHRPLSALLIQAENDEGDLAEMRDGIVHGLRLTGPEIDQIRERLFIYTEDTKTGADIVTLADKLLGTHKTDLLALDPALSYLGGEANSQKDVGGFLRNLVNPVIHRHGCGFILSHHSNKPPTGKEKSDWQAGDFAYLGAGSAEWANWARAVLALRSVGSHDVYELRAGKRGARLHWKDREGKATYARLIGHSQEPGHIYWRDASEADLPTNGRPSSYSAEELFALLPDEGLKPAEWQTVAKEECGISESSFHNYRRALVKQKRIIKSVSGKWQPLLKP